jgi:hypothetical protein
MPDADQTPKLNKDSTSTQADLLVYLLSTISKTLASNFASQQFKDHQHTEKNQLFLALNCLHAHQTGPPVFQNCHSQ